MKNNNLNQHASMRYIFYLMEFINGYRRYFFFLMALLYFIHLGHSPVHATAMFAVSRIIMILFEMPTGAFADNHSRKTSIIISYFIIGTSFMGFFASSNFLILSASYILSDIGWTFQSGSSTAWIIDTLKYGKNKKNISSLFANFFFFDKLGHIIAGLMGFIIIAISFRLIWLIIAILNFLMILISIKYIKEENFKRKSKKSMHLSTTLKKTMSSIKFIYSSKNKRIRNVFIGLIVAAIGFDSFFLIMPLILAQRFNLLESQISGLFSIISIFVLTAPFIGYKLVNKYGFRIPLAILFIITSISILGIGYSQIFILTLALLLICEIADTALSTVHDSCIQYIIPSHSRASIGSATNVVWGIGNSIASLIVSGMLAIFGLSVISYLGGFLILISSIIYYSSLNKI